MPKSTTRNYDAERFGAIIQRLRLERGWTLTKCAQRCGMNATYLGVLEKGGNMPSLATLFEFADVFGMDAAELVREVEQARKQAMRSLLPSREEKLPQPDER
jgi:transcriptional regulator with XRE-family HTH domain